MYQVSNSFLQAMDDISRTLAVEVEISGVRYPTDAIIRFELERGAFDNDVFTIGQTMSNALTLEIFTTPTIQTGDEIKLYTSLRVGEKDERVPLGVYYVDSTRVNKEKMTLTCYDKMVTFIDEYIPSSNHTTLAALFEDVLSQIGMTYDGVFHDAPIKAPLYGYTYRETLGFIASLNGGNMSINRAGHLEIQRFQTVERAIPAKACFSFEVKEAYRVSKVFCQFGDVGITRGDSGGQCVAFENPYVTEQNIDVIYNQLNGLSFTAATLNYRGDLTLDPGDIFQFTDYKGDIYPLMCGRNKLTFNGGLSGQLDSIGESENTNSYAESQLKYKKNITKVTAELGKIQAIVQEIEQSHDGLEERVEKAELEITADAIKSKVEEVFASKDEITDLVTEEQLQSAITQSAESITNTVKDHFYTKEETDAQITSQGYITQTELKQTADSITNTVSQNHYTKQETENTINNKNFATTSQVQQTADNVEFKFSQSGGYNLFRNSAFKNGTVYWWLHQNNNHNGYVQIIPHSDEYGFPDRKVNTLRIGCDEYKDNIECGIAQNVDTVIGKIYTVSCYIAAHRVRKGVIIVRDWDGSWLNAVTFDTTSTGGNGSVYNWQFVQVSFMATANNHNINICMTHTNDNPVMWIARPQIEEGEFANPWTQHANEIHEGIVNINRDGIDVATSYGAHSHFHAGGMSSYNNSNQRTLGIENGGISFHSWNNNALSAYITQSSLWGGDLSSNGLAISTTANGTYLALGTSSLSDVNATLNMDQALTISASDGFQPRGINFWKDVHAHGCGIRQLSHLQLAGSGAIQFDYLHNSPSTIYEAVDNGHSLYVMGGYQMHLGVMEGSGTPHAVIWMRDKTNTHSYTHWYFHNYTMYNMRTASTYANYDTRRIGESYGVTSNVEGVRYLYKNVELVNGKAIRSIPLEYKGCEYDIVSIVCKGKGSAWVETEDENRFEINGDCQSVTIEIMIYPSEELMATSMRGLEEAPILELPKEIKGEVAPFLTNEAIKEENE